MPLRRSTSLTANFAALLALSLGCLHCSGDADDMGANSGAGTAGSAGAHASAGASNHGGAGADGGSNSQAGAAESGAGGADSGGQGGAGEEPAEVIPTFNGCTAADYEDRSADDADRAIGIATEGLTFTPPCLIVAVGQTVRWQGSLGSHPLAPGNPDQPNAGSANSPIVETSSGQSVEFTFEDVGTFPYFCVLHSFGDGHGMAGVVHVKE